MNRYLVWEPDAGQTRSDATSIEAHDTCHAAEVWAERQTNLCASFVDEATVFVARDNNGPGIAVRVTGEMVPTWSARRVSSGRTP